MYIAQSKGLTLPVQARVRTTSDSVSMDSEISFSAGPASLPSTDFVPKGLITQSSRASLKGPSTSVGK